MCLQILSPLFSLFVLVLATGKLEDKSNIEDLNASFNLIFDWKDFEQLGTIFTPNVTYNPGAEAVQGLLNVISTISTFPNTTTTNTVLGTQLIKFRPRFDKEGRSKLAELVSYSIFANFGGGNLTGQSFIIFVKRLCQRERQTDHGRCSGKDYFAFEVQKYLVISVCSRRRKTKGGAKPGGYNCARTKKLQIVDKPKDHPNPVTTRLPGLKPHPATTCLPDPEA